MTHRSFIILLLALLTFSGCKHIQKPTPTSSAETTSSSESEPVHPEYEHVITSSGSSVTLPWGATKICDDLDSMENILLSGFRVLDAYSEAGEAIDARRDRELGQIDQLMQDADFRSELARQLSETMDREDVVFRIAHLVIDVQQEVQAQGGDFLVTSADQPGQTEASRARARQRCIDRVVETHRIEKTWMMRYEDIMAPIYAVLAHHGVTL